MLSIRLEAKNNARHDPVVYLGREIKICDSAHRVLPAPDQSVAGSSFWNCTPPACSNLSLLRPSDKLLTHMDLVPTRAGSPPAHLGIGSLLRPAVLTVTADLSKNPAPGLAFPGVSWESLRRCS